MVVASVYQQNITMAAQLQPESKRDQKKWQDNFEGFAVQPSRKPAFIPSWVKHITKASSSNGVSTINGELKKLDTEASFKDGSVANIEEEERRSQDETTPTATSTTKVKDLPNLQIDTSVSNLAEHPNQDSVAIAYLDRLNIEQCRTPNSESPLIPSSLEKAFLMPDGGQQFIVRREKERARFEAERIRRLCEQPQTEIVNPTPVNVSNIPWMGNMKVESPISPHSRSTPSPFAYSPSVKSHPAHSRYRHNRRLQNVDINTFPVSAYGTRAFIRAPQYIDRELLATIEPDYVNGGRFLRGSGYPAFTVQQPEPVHDNSLNCAVIIEGINPHTKHCDVFDMLHTGPVCSLKLKPPQPPRHMTMSAFVAFTNPLAAKIIVEQNSLTQGNRKLAVRFNTTNGGTHAIPSLYITRVLIIQGPREIMNRPWWVAYFNNICNVQWDRYLNLRCGIPGRAALEFRFSRVEQARTCITHVQNDPGFGDGVIKARFGRDPCDGFAFAGNSGSF